MDFDKSGVLLSRNCEVTENKSFGDTTLRLNCFSLGGSNMDSFGSSRRKLGRKPSNPSDDGCRLVLGLGPTPSAYCDDHSKVGVIKKIGPDTILHQGLLSGGDSILKLGLFGGIREAFNVIDCSVPTQTEADVACLLKQIPNDDGTIPVPIVDEGSTSAKKSGGYMPSLLLAPRMDRRKSLSQMLDPPELGSKSSCLPCQWSPEPFATTDFSAGTVSEPATTETSSDSKTNNIKTCEFAGCAKGARGASGLCIGHGGGHRCQKPGCSKGAESRTAFCKAHGGGKRCQHLRCTKSAEGKTDYCIAHGGGRRCGHPAGCHKAARGKSGLCIKHGGGKRCKVEGCTRSAEGQAGLCISHGGGRRCQYHGCSKGAQGSTMYCKAHGGGKRCIFTGCMKGAEGCTPLCKGHGGGKRCLFDGGGICPKSVHGGTNFCVAHGGGKRCVVPGCTKSARGRTDCCVKHGGGKRCHIEHCGKSAQGSTNCCKAHGGGKRCSGGEGKCEKFARGKSGLCTAHSSLVQEQETKKGGLIGPDLFHGLVSAGSSIVGSSLDNDYSSSGISVVSDCIDTLENPAKRQHLIPPQVLVPLSMKSSPSAPSLYGAEEQEERRNTSSLSGGADWRKSIDFMIPEGRVHGGGLMSLFGGNLKNAVDGI